MATATDANEVGKSPNTTHLASEANAKENYSCCSSAGELSENKIN